jgi:outer membrane immunogenic protein
MFRRSGIALLAAFALSTSVQAADLWNNSGATTSPVFSPTSVSQWGGFYAGVSGGYGWGNTSNSPAIGGGDEDNNSDGWVLGGQVGYNVDMGGFVIGGEADLQWANIGYGEDIPGAGDFSATTDFFSTARARVGVPIGQVMPYGTFGFAYGRGSATLEDAVSTTQTANHLGWTAGVGLEAQATSNLSFKAEYLYVDLGAQAYDGLPGLGDRDIGQRFGVVRAGVNYKF